jgi:hypothetical protein
MPMETRYFTDEQGNVIPYWVDTDIEEERGPPRASITVHPYHFEPGPVQPQGIQGPPPEEAADFIRESEAQTGQASPARQSVLFQPAQGVDNAIPDITPLLPPIEQQPNRLVPPPRNPGTDVGLDLLKLLAPDTVSLARDEPVEQSPVELTPNAGGKIPSADDPRIERSIGEVYNVASSALPAKGAVAGAVSLAGSALPSFVTPAAAEPTIDTVGGPAKITTGELKTLGIMGAVTMGMAFAPRLYSKFKAGALPALMPSKLRQWTTVTPRQVKDAPLGTMAISTPGDLARTYDDVNAGVLRVMRRAGVVAPAANRVQTAMRIQSRAGANALADSAVNLGEMQSTANRFYSSVPLGKLIHFESPEVTQYLHVLDTLDELKLQSLAGLNPRIKNPISTVLGLDLPGATQLKNNLERAYPQLPQISKAYRENLRALRKFETEGEYATSSRANTAYHNRHRPNEVPFRGQRITGDPVDRGSAIESLGEDMRARIRDRLQNEVVGMYVDEVRKVAPDLFKRVTREQLHRNPNYRKNTVSFKRRGKTETYATDPFLADVLRMDPYYINSTAGQFIYGTKRVFESATTGELAPWFAVTSALRSWQIGKLTVPEGMRSPTALGTVLAIPQQLIPQMANAMANQLERSSAGWLGRVFGSGNIHAMAQRLAIQYERSLWFQLQTAGGGRGSILQQQLSANNRLTQAVQHASGPMKAVLEGYRAMLNAVHNSAAFNFAERNKPTYYKNRLRKTLGMTPRPLKSRAELAMESRHLTGDPRVGGEYYVKSAASEAARPIRYETNSIVGRAIAKRVQEYGLLTEAGRKAIPWFNASVQGVKRIGQAYIENPAKFTMRLWLYQIAPGMATYMLSRALGNDPNGRSYVDHQMNGRSEYNKTMMFYIPIPGRPAEEGIEWPRVHEYSIGAHMGEIAMDHAFRSSIFSEKEDFMRAAADSVGVVFDPAWPPAINAALASQGLIGAQGVFAGEAYRKKTDPFDQNGGMPNSIELFMRAMAAGIGDIVGTGAAAYATTPKEEGYAKAIANTFKAAGKRVVSKTPLVRDVANIHAPVSGNTAITEELFKKQRTLRELEQYYREWTKNAGLIGQKPRSKEGEAIATAALGERPPSEPAGINQPPPTNPLYALFIEEMHNRFFTDNPYAKNGDPTGAIGFLSLWNRYGLATRQLQRIRKVTDGNNVTWRRELEESPKQLDYLKRNGVDPYNITQVRNFYERQRQDAARVILFTIRDTEREFSQRLGQPFHIEDVNPYAKGLGDKLYQHYFPSDTSDVQLNESEGATPAAPY